LSLPIGRYLIGTMMISMHESRWHHGTGVDATELVMYRMMNSIVSFHGVHSELRFLPAFTEPQPGTHICIYVDPIGSRQLTSNCSHASVVCFTIHSSSANSRAELRFSGSHCSILRMRRKKHSRSSLSSPSLRVVSRSSRVLERGKGIPAENSP